MGWGINAGLGLRRASTCMRSLIWRYFGVFCWDMWIGIGLACKGFGIGRGLDGVIICVRNIPGCSVEIWGMSLLGVCKGLRVAMVSSLG